MEHSVRLGSCTVPALYMHRVVLPSHNLAQEPAGGSVCSVQCRQWIGETADYRSAVSWYPGALVVSEKLCKLVRSSACLGWIGSAWLSCGKQAQDHAQ